MTPDLIQNPSGRPRRWRGRRSHVKLFLAYTKRGEVFSGRGASRRIRERDPEKPNINSTRLMKSLKAHFEEKRKGIEIIHDEKTNRDFVIRRDTSGLKY